MAYVPQEQESGSSTTGNSVAAAANVQQQQLQGVGEAAADRSSAIEAGAEALQLRVQPAFYRKDANEVLMRDGAAMLRAFLLNAEPFPIRGLLR